MTLKMSPWHSNVLLRRIQTKPYASILRRSDHVALLATASLPYSSLGTKWRQTIIWPIPMVVI